MPGSRCNSYPLLLGLSCLLALAALAATGPAPAGLIRAAWAGDETAEVEALVTGMKSKDSTVRSASAVAARKYGHASLGAPLVRLLSDKELGVREAAMETLGQSQDKSARKKAAGRLNSRLRSLGRHPADRHELLLAIDTLGKLGQSSSIKLLLDDIDLETEVDEARARLSAVGLIPDPEAIDRLIQFLDKGRRRGGRGKQRDIANEVLRAATGANPGGKGPDKWRAWWRENKKDFDFEAVAVARAEAEAKARAKAERKKKKQQQQRGKNGKNGKNGKKKNGKGGRKKGGDEDSEGDA